jgi:hypothetical protein
MDFSSLPRHPDRSDPAPPEAAEDYTEDYTEWVAAAVVLLGLYLYFAYSFWAAVLSSVPGVLPM